MQQLQPFGDKLDTHKGYACDVSFWTVETVYKASADRIGGGREHDRNRACRLDRCAYRDVACPGTDHRNLAADEVGGHGG